MMMQMKNERISEQWSKETTLYYSYVSYAWREITAPTLGYRSTTEQPKSPHPWGLLVFWYFACLAVSVLTATDVGGKGSG